MVMWDYTLYAVNMLYYHWLMKKAVSADGLAEKSQVGNPEIYRESRCNQKDAM